MKDGLNRFPWISKEISPVQLSMQRLTLDERFQASQRPSLGGAQFAALTPDQEEPKCRARHVLFGHDGIEHLQGIEIRLRTPVSMWLHRVSLPDAVIAGRRALLAVLPANMS